MFKIGEQMAKKAGLPPGTPVFVGQKKVEKTKITIIDYDQDHLHTRLVDDLEECFPYKDQESVTWINVDGIHEEALVEQLGKYYGLHPLIIEDILNTQQRLKIDMFEQYLLIVLKMHFYNAETEEIYIEQVSIVLGENFVLTFQEQEGDVFESVRARLQNENARLRKASADYLTYALMDAVVDSFFEILERLGEQIEIVEDEVMNTPDPAVLHKIHFLKRELIFFRKSAWPLRTMIGELERRETTLIQETTLIYLRDLYDHVIQVIDTIETFRDMMAGIHDIYLSNVSNKMNEVMKFLTIIGTIFIPLTFIAGIYGMNFQYMPELTWRWGYFVVLGVMAVMGGGLLCYFKKKHWL
ncbi:magnesium/cobalt transporter CorA [candidate division KSB3 bacterium]|uniref:Magnesium transport protein CorA n=1 Tax=candidate division KSB3 bacterium TaxID=2044937 RepID=A0A9D5JZ15_9BACT|nr:magnesium/cobalt transporter CorA [candidate division KSB3 bacterium]MBD3326785.1 magnesium/cobalt transporter CorA [candidate division KSB3 bacterium]